MGAVVKLMLPALLDQEKVGEGAEGSQWGSSRTAQAIVRGGGRWVCFGRWRGVKRGAGMRLAVGDRSEGGIGGRGCGEVAMERVWVWSIVCV